MTTRSERLNRLMIGVECKTSWEGMEGDGPRRFCHECRRPVYDLAQMTPRQIQGHLEASRGNLCGRLTRAAGRLVMAAEPPVPQPEPSWVRRRASAVAARPGAARRRARAGEARPRQGP